MKHRLALASVWQMYCVKFDLYGFLQAALGHAQQMVADVHPHVATQ